MSKKITAKDFIRDKGLISVLIHPMDIYSDKCISLPNLMEQYAYEVNKTNLFIDKRVGELEEALRECQEVFDQMEENSMCNFIEKILNKR